MKDARLLRVSAAAAIVGAAAQVSATILEPDWQGEPQEAVRVVSESAFFTGDRLIDLIGVVLTVGALTVVGRTLANGPGGEWARLSQPFLVLMGALGAGAIVTGAALAEVADAWEDAAPGTKQAYLASFDTTANVTDALFFAAFLAMGLYLASLGVSIVTGGVYGHWIGWAAACGGALVLAGDLLVLVSEPAFLALLAGFLIFMVVLVALGVSLWRRAASPGHEQAPERAASVTGVLKGEGT
jgi:hypothetical protein